MAQRAEQEHATHITSLLHDCGASHLRARKYGASVIVESGPTSDPIKHFRVRRDTVHLWCLDFAKHTGKWEHTPFRANLDDLVLQVVKQFPWTIAPIHENPERISDPRY